MAAILNMPTDVAAYYFPMWLPTKSTTSDTYMMAHSATTINLGMTQQPHRYGGHSWLHCKLIKPTAL